MKTAILGGTFNPIHIGHLFAAEVVRTTCGYDRILFIPSNLPAHKEVADAVGAEDRLRMVRLAVRRIPGFSWDSGEIRRGGVSYMIDTVSEIERRYRRAGRLGLILGDDLLAGFSSWREADALASRVDIIVCRRQAPVALPFAYPHRYLENALLPISSTDIRWRVARGQTIRFLVPEPVRKYIARRGLYAAHVAPGPAPGREPAPGDAP
jgi:nicotinate-nucleotide adenylyltransferase